MKKHKPGVLILPGRYLVHYSGVELGLISGTVYPWTKAGQLGMVEELADAVGAAGWGEGDTAHMLCVNRNGSMEFSEFSGGFMEDLMAYAEAEDHEKPSILKRLTE